WKVKAHLAYGDTDEPHPNYRLPESNICFDARKDISGWQNPDFDDTDWSSAEEYGSPPIHPWNQLVKRPIPMWKDSGLQDFTNAGEIPGVSSGKLIVAKLPYNAHITPYLKIEAPSGLKIDIRTDDYEGGGPPNVRAEYITKAGIQEYESLGWMNGHSVHYSIPPGVKVHSLKYRETGYNTEFAGSFECDDESLNELWRKSLRTLYVTMRDTYFDCPDRERAQWWGDAVNELGETFYSLDARSSQLTKKAILELMNWQREDNTIYSPVPSGNYDRELPMQMLASVGYYGFWTYCKYSGDVDTIKSVYPAVRRYMSVWGIGQDGLVIPRAGGWTWGDWGENKDMAVLFNAWYHIALRGQRKIARLCDLNDEVDEISGKMATIESNFNKAFWNGKSYRAPDYEGETDDRCHALAVVSGLAKPDQYEAIRTVLKNEYHASPYMEKYVLEALYIMRFEVDAIQRMKMRYRDMVEHPLTTLWEDWRIGGSGGGTTNHAWSGGPLTIMSQYAAGIAPEKIGYDVYHVLPQMGALTSVRTSVPSVKGDIVVEINRGEGWLSLYLESPEATTAIVGIPKDAVKEIVSLSINDVRIWLNGHVINSCNGVEFLGEDTDYYRFSVEPGTWRFRADNKV
ncbi:alpha-L-rhamnosidase C-terminal domain-containing protein, partial [Candidatus Poribacteria bacterium]